MNKKALKKFSKMKWSEILDYYIPRMNYSHY